MPSEQIRFSFSKSFSKRPKAEALAVPCWEGKEQALPAVPLPSSLEKELHAIESKDFSGSLGQASLDYHPAFQEKRLILFGLGKKEEGSLEQFRRAGGVLQHLCSQMRIEKLNLFVPEERGAEGLFEGLSLANYSFSYSSDPKKRPFLIKELSLIGGGPLARLAAEWGAVAEGVYLARDLVNGNADAVTPAYLGCLAKDLAKLHASIKSEVWDKARIEKEKMGLLLAVGRGASCDPAFIICRYRGESRSKEHIVLVGKGVTYDTGGLCIKPSNSMETMKSDMAGAACCFGVLLAAAQLKLKLNLTVVVPAVENAVGSRSYKLGDVYESRSGKTVEIGNTDAEGRLVLADALSYAVQKLKPSKLIDFATLTGAIRIALGDEIGGLMSNDDALARGLIEAGEKSYERVWRLPLLEEYKKSLSSEIADLKNLGGRGAGSIKAALFLQEFVGETPWAHFDIAGTAYLEEKKRYLPKYASGFGVRLTIEYLKSLC